ncbi:MAG TPA: hypothetical protein VF172_10925 [Nitrososphaera sp.]
MQRSKVRKEKEMMSSKQQQQAVMARANGDDNNGGNVSMMCGHCGKQPAEIFQITGDYCIGCWQEVTHSRV